MLVEEEVVVELVVKVGMTVKEEARDVVAACIPPERKEKSELTLSSPMSPFSQMRKPRHLPSLPEYLASGAILEEVRGRSRSLGPVHRSWDKGINALWKPGKCHANECAEGPGAPVGSPGSLIISSC